MNILYHFIAAKWSGNNPPTRFHLACSWICLYELKKWLQRSKQIKWAYVVLFLKQIYWATKIIITKERTNGN